MNVLVVGCGYVGMTLGAELVREGHAVHGVRRKPNQEGQMRALGIQPLFADITRRETLDRLPNAFDWVVNCTSASGGSGDDYRGVYIEGNRNLLDWLAGSKIQKFVYTSSTGVYGQNDGSIVEESSPTAPEAETARVLVQAEELLLEGARRGLPVVILRVAGIYGPGRGYWLKQFLAGEVRLEGSGSRILNMVHLDDVVGSIIAALHRGKVSGIYNVVDDEPVSQLAMFQWLAAKLGRSVPPPGAAAAFKRAATNKRVSNRRLRSELGYKLKFPSFREGFSEEIGK